MEDAQHKSGSIEKARLNKGSMNLRQTHAGFESERNQLNEMYKGNNHSKSNLTQAMRQHNIKRHLAQTQSSFKSGVKLNTVSVCEPSTQSYLRDRLNNRNSNFQINDFDPSPSRDPRGEETMTEAEHFRRLQSFKEQKIRAEFQRI